MQKKTFAIIGAGPSGGALAAHLVETGYQVQVVDVLEDHLLAMRENGLEISGYEEKKVVLKQATSKIADLAGSDPDYLCIATKTSAYQAMLPEIAKILNDKVTVVAVQNGLDNEEYLAQTFPNNKVCRVVVNWAGGLERPGKIRMVFFHPPNWVGAVNAESIDAGKELASIMTEAGLATEFTQNIKRYEWEKTILNSAMSPTAALTGMTMKQVMDHESSLALVKNLIAEGINVAEQAGIGFEDGFFQHCVDYLASAGPHKPSLAVDLEAGRTTEIDFLNARIVENAKRLGLQAPYHEEMTLLIKARQDNRI